MGDKKRGRESLQVAELLNYLAMENHVSTVRGVGLNVSISANQHECVDICVDVQFLLISIERFVCVSMCVCVCAYVCTCIRGTLSTQDFLHYVQVLQYLTLAL